MKEKELEGTIYIDVTHMPNPSGDTEIQKVEVLQMRFGSVYFDLDEFTDNKGRTIGERLMKYHPDHLVLLVDMGDKNNGKK